MNLWFHWWSALVFGSGLCAVSLICRLLPLLTFAIISAFITLKLSFMPSNLPSWLLKLTFYSSTQNSTFSVQNSTKSTHIIPILQQLHWLPVVSCIQFKSYIYKPLHGLSPTSRAALIKQNSFNHTLTIMFIGPWKRKKWFYLKPWVLYRTISCLNESSAPSPAADRGSMKPPR